MRNNDSFQKFAREVSRRANAFRGAMSQLLLGLVVTHRETALEKARVLQKAAEDLCSILTEQDRPPWLKPVHDSVLQFLADATDENAQLLVVEIMQQYHLVNPKHVLPESNEESPYKFDDFYKQARDEANIPDLFDAHVDALAAIIDSGEIESVTVLNALSQLISTLRANRNASYAAVKQSLFFARFVQNAVLITLKKVPGLGILVEAAERTLSDTEKGVEKLERQMQSHVRSAIEGSLPRIERAPQIIEQQIMALPAPTSD